MDTGFDSKLNAVTQKFLGGKCDRLVTVKSGNVTLLTDRLARSAHKTGWIAINTLRPTQHMILSQQPFLTFVDILLLC